MTAIMEHAVQEPRTGVKSILLGLPSRFGFFDNADGLQATVGNPHLYIATHDKTQASSNQIISTDESSEAYVRMFKRREAPASQPSKPIPSTAGKKRTLDPKSAASTEPTAKRQGLAECLAAVSSGPKRKDAQKKLPTAPSPGACTAAPSLKAFINSTPASLSRLTAPAPKSGLSKAASKPGAAHSNQPPDSSHSTDPAFLEDASGAICIDSSPEKAAHKYPSPLTAHKTPLGSAPKSRKALVKEPFNPQEKGTLESPGHAHTILQGSPQGVGAQAGSAQAVGSAPLEKGASSGEAGGSSKKSEKLKSGSRAGGNKVEDEDDEREPPASTLKPASAPSARPAAAALAAAVQGHGKSTAFTAEHLQSKKLADLKDLCKQRGLPVSGTKDGLIQKLVEYQRRLKRAQQAS